LIETRLRNRNLAPSEGRALRWNSNLIAMVSSDAETAERIAESTGQRTAAQSERCATTEQAARIYSVDQN
jgi:hypothetical protein